MQILKMFIINLSFKRLLNINSLNRYRNHYVITQIYRNYCAAEQKSATESDKKGLVLGVYEGENEELIFTPATQRYNDKMEGLIGKMIKRSGFRSYEGNVHMYNNIDNEYWSIACVGLGKEKQGYNPLEAIDDGLEISRTAAAKGIRKLSERGIGVIHVEGLGNPEQAAEGASLAAWLNQENKSKNNWKIFPTLELFDDQDPDAWQRGLFKAEAQNLVRRICDIPSNQMTPMAFADLAVNVCCACGIKVEIHQKDWIESKNLLALLTVAKGSCEPPLFLEINYCGGPVEERPILLVGKGVTFDSGGLCLKDSKKMDFHRADISGAATVLALIRAAASLSLPMNLVGVIPLCENMPSGMSMKPGDIYRAINGKTIQIEDTDNEGRLLVSEGITFGLEAYKPKLVIDVMTSNLKASAYTCLGSSACAVYSNSETMWKQIRRASTITGDRVWRLPLWKYYNKRVTNSLNVDLNNKGVGRAYTCLAAAFMEEFIDCVDWIHLDTSGVGLVCEDKVYPYYEKGRMTGRPIRTLIQFLYQLACLGDNKG